MFCVYSARQRVCKQVCTRSIFRGVSLYGNNEWRHEFSLFNQIARARCIPVTRIKLVVCVAGNDRTNPARYHPFYITDSSEGGYGQRSEGEQKQQTVFAGVAKDRDGYPYPTAGVYTPRLSTVQYHGLHCMWSIVQYESGTDCRLVWSFPCPEVRIMQSVSFRFFFCFTAGRYCEWVHQTVDRNAEFEKFEDYKKTLTLQCDNGEPSALNWTVAEDTPNVVYYQVRRVLIYLV